MHATHATRVRQRCTACLPSEAHMLMSTSQPHSHTRVCGYMRTTGRPLQHIDAILTHRHILGNVSAMHAQGCEPCTAQPRTWSRTSAHGAPAALPADADAAAWAGAVAPPPASAAGALEATAGAQRMLTAAPTAGKERGAAAGAATDAGPLPPPCGCVVKHANGPAGLIGLIGLDRTQWDQESWQRS